VRRSSPLSLKTVLLVLGSVLAVPLIAVGAYVWFFKPVTLRPRPLSTEEMLYAGVHYRRQVTQTPRALIWHLITVDLAEPGVRILVTPPEKVKERGVEKRGEGGFRYSTANQKETLEEITLRYPLVARSTTAFLTESNCQVAINGDDFEPKNTNSIRDYFPHAGDAVNVIGNAMSDGTRYARKEGAVSLWITKDGTAQIGAVAPPEAWSAIGGKELPLPSLINSKPRPTGDKPDAATVVAVDATGKKLYLLVVDGQQPGYSEGATQAELGAILFGVGATAAIRLDGGGSSTLVAERDGHAVVLNTPIDQKRPGRERVVANHLGIFASKTESQKAALRH